MTDYVVTGLVKRRAELTGEIESTHERLRQMVLDLEHLDAAILQFDPDYEIEAMGIRPPYPWGEPRRAGAARENNICSASFW